MNDELVSDEHRIYNKQRTDGNEPACIIFMQLIQPAD